MRVSQHAVRRYVERLKPALDGDMGTARRELEQLVGQATVVKDRPEWIPDARDDADRDEAHRWLVVEGCGIVMPVNRQYVVLTVLANGGLSDQTRQRRNDRRRDRQHRRRARSQRYISKGPQQRAWLPDSPA